MLHGLLMDHFSKRREVIGFRTSVIYDLRQPAAADLRGERMSLPRSRQ